MSDTKEYDPQKVQVIVGAAPVSGFAPGTFITVEQDENNFSTRVGADGEVTRTRLSNRMAVMNLTLLATAVFNAVLSGLEQTEVIFPVLLKDGATIISAGEAWVEKPPGFERSGDDSSDTEWIIRLARWRPFFGGNP